MSTASTLTHAEVEMVAIGAIVIGPRRRKSLRNIAALAKSLETRGLAHPIVVRNGNELVAGRRRLEAASKLGWSTIPVRRVERMSDDELRALELEENAGTAPDGGRVRALSLATMMLGREGG